MAVNLTEGKESNYTFANLLKEHRDLLRELRLICSKIVSNDELSKDISSLLKVSNLIIKLIPLEQQVSGTYCIKNIEKIRETLFNENNDNNISLRDVEILKKYISELSNQQQIQ